MSLVLRLNSPQRRGGRRDIAEVKRSGGKSLFSPLRDLCVLCASAVNWVVVFAVICVFAAAWPGPICVAQPSSLPHLSKQGAATQLIVDGKPFLVLGGELGNSSSSSLEYMRPVWPKLVALNLNTVLAPVYWELIEPVEGKFDFTLVDGLIRKRGNMGCVSRPCGSPPGKTSCPA